MSQRARAEANSEKNQPFQAVEGLLYENNPIRAFLHPIGLTFLGADVCRGCNLRAYKGSYGLHISRLPEKDKILVDRSLVFPATPTSSGEVDPKNDGPSRGASAKVWLVTEAGMYTLALRCRDALKEGTAPYRFRDWVTSEVLPAVRQYGLHQSAESASGHTASDEAQRREENAFYERILNEHEFMAVALSVISVWYNLSCRRTEASALAAERLGLEIRSGRAMAERCLEHSRPARSGAEARNTAPH